MLLRISKPPIKEELCRRRTEPPHTVVQATTDERQLLAQTCAASEVLPILIDLGIIEVAVNDPRTFGGSALCLQPRTNQRIA